MIGRTAARVASVCILGLTIAGTAHASRLGGRGGGGHFAGAPSFHGGGFSHFRGGGFHSRVFIGGALFAPLYFPYYYAPAYYPPAYYPPAYYSPPPAQYVEPEPAPAPSYWYYCPSSQGYYPYVWECPGGWQRVAPQPPS